MRKKNGFTLIEMTIVMGLLAIVGSMSMVVNMDMYRGYMFRNEQNVLISVLEKARSQSVNNICLGSTCTDGQPHGVKILPGKYVIFQGADYDSREAAADEEINAASSMDFSGSSISEVVFQQLSGDVSAPGEIKISNNIRTVTISINNEGQIDY
jgi:prepilin-type N-terminal cleavage/methylation domain-containing protein